MPILYYADDLLLSDKVGSVDRIAVVTLFWGYEFRHTLKTMCSAPQYHEPPGLVLGVDARLAHQEHSPRVQCGLVGVQVGFGLIA